tara:strand:- start:130 stop:546 length:417 start_codon:yes stop_codon:yes gene_type:complete
MNILFLCVGNSARSQIAEGLAKEMLGSSHNIQSAGSDPAKKIHKAAINTMSEVGIDISKHYPKSIEEIDKSFIDDLDFVITLCAEESCPIISTKAKIMSWPNEDPDNDSYNDRQNEVIFRKTRENIFKLLKNFMLLNT